MQDQDFNDFWRRWLPEVIKYARAIVGPPLAEEVAQSTMLAVWQHRDDFPADDGAVWTWLYRTTRNLCLKALSADSRQRVRTTTSIHAAEHENLGYEHVEQATVEKLFAAEVLGNLSQRDRQIFLLTYDGTYSDPEVAGILGISVTALSTSKARMKQRMARIVTELRARDERGSGRRDFETLEGGQRDG